MMNDFYNAIYLSPHFDDAALSCGGQIYDLTTRGKSVLVVTIMAGVPVTDSASLAASQYAAKLHERWQLQGDVVEARQAEDMAACEVLGADWQHWDFFDCIYRVDAETKRPFYTADSEIFGEIDPAESGLVTQIADRLALLPACDQLYVPLTLGNHVDHQLTRAAAEACFSAESLSYYEDYPYARDISAVDFVATAAEAWQAKVIEISENGVGARIKAIRCFESQVSTFFKDEADLAAQVEAYIHAIGGERLWIMRKKQVNFGNKG